MLGSFDETALKYLLVLSNEILSYTWHKDYNI